MTPDAARASFGAMSPTTAEANKALVARYVEDVLNRGDMAAADELFAPDYRRHVSPISTALTREAQKQRLAGIRAAFPDWRVTADDVLADGDRVAFRATIRATQRGPFQNIPPTGREVTVSAIDIVRIEKGKIVEHWGGPDLFSLLQQLQ